MHTQHAKLCQLHRLIAHRGTGSPNEIARRLHISRATVFRYKNILHGLGADIVWIHGSRSYMYANTFELHYDASKYVVNVNGQRREKVL